MRKYIVVVSLLLAFKCHAQEVIWSGVIKINYSSIFDSSGFDEITLPALRVGARSPIAKTQNMFFEIIALGDSMNKNGKPIEYYADSAFIYGYRFANENELEGLGHYYMAHSEIFNLPAEFCLLTQVAPDLTESFYRKNSKNNFLGMTTSITFAGRKLFVRVKSFLGE